MRTHGHRAATIDPLDLIQREEVGALDPRRYGLVDEGQRYNVNGIIWTHPVSEGNEVEDWWTLDEITRHLREVYVGRIAYEVSGKTRLFFFFFLVSLDAQYMHSPSKTERLWFSHLLESQRLPSAEDNPIVTADEEMKRHIHRLLARSEVLDNFLQLKFPNLKRVCFLVSRDFIYHYH